MTKTIEEKYQSMDEITHVLKKSGMWIGSIKKEKSQKFVFDSEQSSMTYKEIEYIPGMLKLIDEVISNSCDEYRRKDNLGLTEVTVKLDRNGWISIKDNGGIPIVKHKEAGVYLPEFLFGQLRSSSNYDDSEARNGVGTNGLGSTLLNIWSKEFIINSADGKKSFHLTWKDNMREKKDDLKISKSTEHFTETKFLFDYGRFEDITDDEYISDDLSEMIEKRCIDAAAGNVGLKIIFILEDNGNQERKSEWKFSRFEEYIELYSNYIDINSGISSLDKQKTVWFFPDGNVNIGFVNGAECSQGTHIDAIHSLINNSISSYIVSKKKLELKPKMVEGKYSTFCSMRVDNPTYDSQTKEQLTTPVHKFIQTEENYEFNIPKKFFDEICKSDIIDTMIDWYNQKQEVEDQKNLRKLNHDAKKKIKRGEKFIDANSHDRLERELWIFEGDSAQAGFRMARNPRSQAAYLLRGVILNTEGMQPTKVMQNQELSDIISIIGLQWGVKNRKEDLNYSKIVIATDADVDGSRIAGLLLVFFNHFPELYEYNMICRSISPIMIAVKGNDIVKIYSFKEYREKEEDLKGYKIKYAKGLGSLNNAEYKEMMQHPKFNFFTKDNMADQSLNKWFGRGIARVRKDILKSEV
jgi:DNA topoisomerase-2